MDRPAGVCVTKERRSVRVVGIVRPMNEPSSSVDTRGTTSSFLLVKQSIYRGSFGLVAICYSNVVCKPLKMITKVYIFCILKQCWYYYYRLLQVVADLQRSLNKCLNTLKYQIVQKSKMDKFYCWNKLTF